MRRGPDVREWGCGTLDRERTLPAAPLLAHLAVPAPGASERERTHLDAIRDALRHAAEAPLLGRRFLRQGRGGPRSPPSALQSAQHPPPPPPPRPPPPQHPGRESRARVP